MRSLLRTPDVGDRDFRDPRTLRARQRRNEPVHVAVEADLFDHRSAIGLERRPEVAQRDAGRFRDQPVGDPRRQPARPEVVGPVLAPAADHVVAFGELGEQQRKILGRMLQIAVHRDDNPAACPVEPGGERRRLAVVARQLHHAHAAIDRRDRPQLPSAPVVIVPGIAIRLSCSSSSVVRSL